MKNWMSIRTILTSGWACIRYGIGETLVKYSDDMELEPWLAKEWGKYRSAHLEDHTAGSCDVFKWQSYGCRGSETMSGASAGKP